MSTNAPILAPAARKDLREIFEFIAQDSPAAARRVRAAIYQAIERLGQFPKMGHSRTDLTDRPVRLWTAMGRYSIIYLDNRTPVEIVRIFGPGRDVTALLR